MNKYALINEKRLSIQQKIFSCSPLIEILKKFAEKDALYLPAAGNLGDALIGLGTLDLFDKFGLKFQTHDTILFRELPEVEYIVLGGGGGWLDGIWKHHAQILTPFFEKGGQALILPSTVSGFTEYFRKYAKQITVFARDPVTYEHLSSIDELKGSVFLCHDLAFAVDFSRLNPTPNLNKSGSLNIFRQDEESLHHEFYRNNYDFSLLWNGVSWYERETCENKLKALVNILDSFEEIHTDRLHMSVLATFLGANVSMYPGSYFKNEAIYKYSLVGFPNVRFCSEHPAGGVSMFSEEKQQKENELEQLRKDYEFLNEELQETRYRNLLFAENLEGKNRGSYSAVQDSELEAFLNSKGYKVWNLYNSIYENKVVGPSLRKIRSLFGRLLRAIGIVK